MDISKLRRDADNKENKAADLRRQATNLRRLAEQHDGRNEAKSDLYELEAEEHDTRADKLEEEAAELRSNLKEVQAKLGELRDEKLKAEVAGDADKVVELGQKISETEGNTLL